MNKKPFIFLLAALALSSCNKTNLLYGANAYNSPVFDENYYTEWEGIDKLGKQIQSSSSGSYGYLFDSDCVQPNPTTISIGGKEIKKYAWAGEKSKQFGYNNNLAKIEKGFSYGVTSKLFDGRVRCERQYQKSRVQLNKSGFAMYFPKLLVSVKYLGFACRGGTDYPKGQEFEYQNLEVNFYWSFYIHLNNGKYHKVTYTIKNAKIPVDFGGNTAFINFSSYMPEDNFSELQGAAAMSLKWEVNDPTKMATRPELTDDYKTKDKTKKHHLALMLYEVFIGDSVWH